MILTSPVFRNNEVIDLKYTSDGDNISPPLKITEVPANAKSLLLMLEDPTAEIKPCIYWCVFNIPPYIKEFQEGQIPEGAIEGVTSTYKYGYHAPPSSDSKEYIFKLFALDCELSLPADSDRKVILKAMMGHVIEEVLLVVKYTEKSGKPSYFE